MICAKGIPCPKCPKDENPICGQNSKGLKWFLNPCLLLTENCRMPELVGNTKFYKLVDSALCTNMVKKIS